MGKDHLEIQLEDIRGKFDPVLDGLDTLRQEIQDTREELGEKINFVGFKVETLNRKIDRVEESLNRKIDGARDELGQKIDAVATDLATHRADTEGHRAGYQVSETRD